MMKTLSFSVVTLLIALLSCVFGYYNASNDVFLFVKVLNANGHINTIRYLEDEKYEKIYEYQKRSLEENVAAIDDILISKPRISKAPGRYFAYKELLSLPLDEDIERIKNKYEKIRTSSEH